MAEAATLSSSDSMAIVAQTQTTSASNPNEGHSILSEKVARALAVRTDTVAMKAALDALAHLDHGTSGGAVDSRSVRTAMEQDALQQALVLQRALEGIVESVSALRQGCASVAQTAVKLREASYMPVVTAETAISMLPSTTTTTNAATTSMTESSSQQLSFAHDASGSGDSPSSFSDEDAATAQEQKLAAVLADAFLHRDLARRRLEAVHAFLEKFDLSEEDSLLLDQYNFDDVSSSLDPTEGFQQLHDNTYHEGVAFLNALARVRKIRRALNQTFGASAAADATRPGGDDNNQGGLGASSALRMMESLSQKQEGAYERLYHWLQKQLQLFPTANSGYSSNSNSMQEQMQPEYYNDDILQHDFVLQALHTLRHVPAFYSHLTELIAACRRASVTRRFLLALTAGSVDAPPIEMKAHDSVACTFEWIVLMYKHIHALAVLNAGTVSQHPL